MDWSVDPGNLYERWLGTRPFVMCGGDWTRRLTFTWFIRGCGLDHKMNGLHTSTRRTPEHSSSVARVGEIL